MFGFGVVRYTALCFTQAVKRSVVVSMGRRNYSSSQLTSCEELHDKLQEPDWKNKLRIIDARYGLDGRDYRSLHQENRILGSRFFSFEECRDLNSPYMTMLPSAEQFSNYVTKMGISNEHHVIVYDYDEALNLGAFFSPRVWWMFRAFGHNKVSVLDGGFGKWISDGYSTVSGPYTEGENLPESESFSVSGQPKFVVNFESMKENIESNEPLQIIDTRLHEEFASGHIPNSLMTPYTDFFNKDRTMKSKEDLALFFEEQYVDLNSDAIVTCQIGVTAAIAAHTFLQCTGRNVDLYDGSFNEWSDRVPDNLVSSE